MTVPTSQRGFLKAEHTDDPDTYAVVHLGAALDALDVHTHAASDITSGIIPIARLASGTPNGTKFIRDDGTLAVPAGGAGGAATDITYTPTGNIAATNVQSAIDELDTEKSATGHTHAASDVTSGVLGSAQLGSGSATANTILHGDQTWGGINATTQITAGTVPAARLGSGSPSSATLLDGTNAWRALVASDIGSGTIATARLGSGTADATKILYGNSTWGAPPTLPAGGTTNQGLLKDSATDGDADWHDVVTPTSHDTLDHSTALSTAQLGDIGNVLFQTTPVNGDTLNYLGGFWAISKPYATITTHAMCDAKRSTGGAITSGQTTLTRSGGDTFTSTAVDTGKVVIIPGAGAAGVDLVTTISTVTNSTTAVVAAAASTTVSGKIIFWGTNDTTTIAADLATLPTSGGTLVLHGPAICNGELSLASKRNVRIIGRGGLTGRSMTAASGFNIGLPPSGLIYVKTGSATFLTATQTQGVELVDIGIHYVNAGYTGKLIDLAGHASDTDLRTLRPLIDNCTVGALIDGLAGCVLVTDSYAWKPVYRRCVFVGGTYQVFCVAGGYVNARTFDDCTFGLYSTSAIFNVGEGMSVRGGMIERNYDATVANRVGKFITCDASNLFDGCSIEGTWFSDVNNAAAASSWIDIKPGGSFGGGLSISGCRMGGGNNQTFVNVSDDGFTGLIIQGGSAPFGGTLLDGNAHTDLIGYINGSSIAHDSGSLTLTTGTAGAGTTVTVV